MGNTYYNFIYLVTYPICCKQQSNHFLQSFGALILNSVILLLFITPISFIRQAFTRRMLKGPGLKSPGLYISVFQDRPDRGRLI